MFKFIKNNKITPTTKDTIILNQNCINCNSKIFLNSKCTNCGKDIFNFIKDKTIKIDNIENFLKDI